MALFPIIETLKLGIADTQTNVIMQMGNNASGTSNSGKDSDPVCAACAGDSGGKHQPYKI